MSCQSLVLKFSFFMKRKFLFGFFIKDLNKWGIFSAVCRLNLSSTPTNQFSFLEIAILLLKMGRWRTLCQGLWTVNKFCLGKLSRMWICEGQVLYCLGLFKISPSLLLSWHPKYCILVPEQIKHFRRKKCTVVLDNRPMMIMTIFEHLLAR